MAGNALNRFSWGLLGVLTLLILLMIGVTAPAHWDAGPMHPAPDSHAMPEEDFSNLWAAGRMVRAGKLADVFGAASFQAWKAQKFGAPLQEEDWVYPPTVLLLGVPLSILPLLAGFLLWDAGTLAIAVLLLRQAGLSWPVVLAGVAGPAAWRSLTLGQYGIITGALVVAGLLLAPRRPRLAGVMLGISTLKPQQGVIVPIAFLAARNFRALATGAAAVGALAVAVVLAFGWPAWALFVHITGGTMRGLLEAKPPQNYISDGVSVFWMLRTAGAGIGLAYAGQVCAAAASGIVCWQAWRDPAAPVLPRMALTVCLSLFVTPYGFTSDMVALSLALAQLAACRGWKISPVDVMVWLWPAYCPFVTLKTGLLLTPFVVLYVAWQAHRQMRGGYASA